MQSTNRFSIKADQKIFATLLTWVANATQDKLISSILETKNHTKKGRVSHFHSVTGLKLFKCPVL